MNPFRPKRTIQEYAPINGGERSEMTTMAFKIFFPGILYRATIKPKGTPSRTANNVVNEETAKLCFKVL